MRQRTGGCGWSWHLDTDDGVELLGRYLRVGTNSFRVKINGIGGCLNGWMDLNGNGSWEDQGDHVFNNLDLNPGTHDLRVDLLPGFVPRVATRVRWGACGLGYSGPAGIGEVEDYIFRVP